MRKQRYSTRSSRCGKNLDFSKDACLEKERMQSKMTTRKVRVGLKQTRELSKTRLGWRLAWWGSTEKKASHLLRLGRRHQYFDQRSNQNRAACMASTAVETEGENDQMARSAPSNSCLNVVVQSLTPFELSQNSCWPS